MSLDFNLDRYLERLGLASLPAGDGRRLACAGPPSVEGLRILHHAHVERVPYENLDIQLGRPMSIGPLASAARIAAGRGGYCYQLNGAFGLLLSALGYSVQMHKGGAQMHARVRERRDRHFDDARRIENERHGLPVELIPVETVEDVIDEDLLAGPADGVQRRAQ